MKTVTLTDLRRNLDEYLKQTQNGEIGITKYGKVVAKLIGTVNDQEVANGNGSADDSDSEDKVTNAAA